MTNNVIPSQISSKLNENGIASFHRNISRSEFATCLDNASKFCHQILFEFSALGDATLRECGGGDQFTSLSFQFIAESPQEIQFLHQLIQLCSAIWRDHYGSRSYQPAFCADITPNFVVTEPLLLPLDSEKRNQIEAGLRLWTEIADFSERSHGQLLSRGELVNFAIKYALSGDEREFDASTMMFAIATWLGNELVAQAGCEWMNFQDAEGSEVCVTKVNRSGMIRYVFPFSATAKRL